MNLVQICQIITISLTERIENITHELGVFFSLLYVLKVLFCGSSYYSDGAQIGLGHTGMEQGAVGMPGSALYLKVFISLHLSTKFPPLSYQIVWQWKGRAKMSLFLSSCWCQIWDIPTLGWQRGEHMASDVVRHRVKPREICFISAFLTWLIWASWLIQLRDWDTQWNIVWESESLQVPLLRKSCSVSSWSSNWLGSCQFQICSACEVISYCFAFKLCAHHMLWEKRRQVVLGLKCSLFMCSLPSSCPFPKLGALFTLLPLTWAL